MCWVAASGKLPWGVVEAVRARAITATTVTWINELIIETAMLRSISCDAIRRKTAVSTVGLSA